MNILEIDIGEGFIPIGCLTGFNESEETQTIPTTTRDNDGWRSSRGTYQTKSINFSAYLNDDNAILSYPDLVDIKRDGIIFDWRVEDDDGRGFFTEMSIEQSVGTEVQYSGSIKVVGAPSADPQLPFVDAGENITLPVGVTTAELSGFVLNPDGSPITFLWTFVSGPTTPVITNETTLTPQVSGMTVVGEYVFRLTATNDAGSASDTVLVGEVDVAPGINISLPQPGGIITGTSDIEYTITYTGATSITLAVVDITINNPVGTVAVGSVVVQNTSSTTRTVVLQNVTGDGTVGISIASGTASNANGSAPAAGPSVAALVSPVPPPAPAGYTVTFVDDPIQNNNTQINVADGNGEAVTASYFMSSSGGGTLTDSGIPIGATPFNIPINVSALGNGLITMNFVLINSGGTQNIQNIQTTKSV